MPAKRKKKKPLDSTFDNSKQLRLTTEYSSGCLEKDEEEEEEKLRILLWQDEEEYREAKRKEEEDEDESCDTR